jgi:hypothetical protein
MALEKKPSLRNGERGFVLLFFSFHSLLRKRRAREDFASMF